MEYFNNQQIKTDLRTLWYKNSVASVSDIKAKL